MANTTFGVLSFINLLLALMRLYQRHKENVDYHFAPELVAAFEVLLAAVDAVQDANPRGPDRAVQTNIGGGL